MRIDTYTKAVLTVIAISLFLIGINPWVNPPVAHAEWGHFDQKALNKIGVHFEKIANGTCRNIKLC